MTRAERLALLRGIYVIVDDGPRTLDVAHAALFSGVRVLQYRAKHGVDEARVRVLREVTYEHGALFLFDDDWRMAQAYACDGVHLGPEDDGFLDVAAVRRSWPQAIIGLSCGMEEEMRMAHAAGADYAGAGAVYATSSKSDAGEPIGIDGLRRVVAAAPLPVAAIGGINRERIAEIKRTGVAMAAVISAVSEARNPYDATEALMRAWESA